MDYSNIPEFLYNRRFYDGLWLPPGIAKEDFESAVSYKPRHDDLFVVSFPKSGTTWVQYIVCLIYNDGTPQEGPLMFGATPFLEFIGEDGVLEYKKPIPIKSHLPLQYLPFTPDAKYIYVVRNPKDTLVSMFFHNKAERGCPEYVALTMDIFFKSFIEGTTDWGDYFEHVIQYYNHRNDNNVLFLTYESIKADPRSAILQIAHFMGSQYGEKLENDESLLEKIIHEASFSCMKPRINESMKAAMDGNVYIPPKMKMVIERLNQVPSMQGFAELEFVRKGVVGDHVNHLTPEQERQLSQIAREKLSCCPDLIAEWADQLT